MKSVEHTPGFVDVPSVTSVREAEKLLSDWFGAEVILTSSGRAAILLYLEALGFNRYLNRVAVPRLISFCVLDAIIRRGFPIDVEGDPAADATILYHQYGLPQTQSVSGLVIEDICHSFFSNATSGAREWRGEVGIFSLPKFFRLNGMSGGLVMVNGSRARQIRQMRDGAARDGSMENYQQLKALRSGDRSAVERLYLSRLLNPQIFDHETGGMPVSLGEIRGIGEKRQTILERLLGAIGDDSLPVGWSGLFRESLPFALPVFGNIAWLQQLNGTLAEIGITAGIYKIDVARTMAKPEYRTGVLLPCHHEIPVSTLNNMTDILKEARARWAA